MKHSVDMRIKMSSYSVMAEVEKVCKVHDSLGATALTMHRSIPLI